MKEKLQADLRNAMKSGEQTRLMTIRGVMAEITRLEKDVCRPANESEILQIIKRERARRDESLGYARQANRSELIRQYQDEANVLDSYMPAAIDPETLRAAIHAQLEAGVTQMGAVMKALKEKFGAALDGKTASELVKQELARK